MPAVAAAEPQPGELARALSEAGEKELRRMIRAARMARGRFHLFPIESDFTPALRAAFVERLRDDLAANGLRLRVVTLTPACWNVLAALEQEPPILPGDVLLLTGLEATPGIVREAGAKPQRPPALSALNQWREVLRQQIVAPLFAWCPTYVYTALLEHAPDFFDQYTAKFQFTNAVRVLFPEAVNIGLKFSFAVEDAFTDKPSYGSQAAVDFYRKQVAVSPNPTSERAVALINLVNALVTLPEPNRAGVASEAKTCAEEVLRLLAKRRSKKLRFAWAVAQMELGAIYAYLLPGDQNSNQHRALACYKAALRVYTEFAYPTEWAKAQLECGESYAKLTDGEGDTNSSCAIACYVAALRVYTKADYPTEWAETQFCLGQAYSKLCTGDKQANLQCAVACYEAALCVYTEADYPAEWVITQIYLGGAFISLYPNAGASYLQQSIFCCKAALRVLTEVQHPQQWAMLNDHLAALFVMDNDIDNAEKAYQKARRGFTAVGDVKGVQEVEAALQSLASRPMLTGSSA